MLKQIKDTKYVITEDGVVGNSETGWHVKQSIDHNGRKSVMLDGKKYYVHRLLHDAFIYPVPEDANVQMINGDYSDLRLDNIRIVSKSASSRRAAKKTKFSGKALSTKSASHIRKDYKKGVTQVALSRQYGVSTRTIRRIVNNK
jgi:hypothetical protein